MEIRTVRTEGLGDSTYILAVEGIGIVVDPQRDIDRFLVDIGDLDIEVRWVLETHLHNDYISGASDLATALGAELVIPAGAAPVYRHRPAFHLEEFATNDLTIRPIHTPGHTPEHMSYLVVMDGVESAVFSGGSLLVGSAGRSDLLGMDRADTLARLQYQSVNRLANLSPTAGLYPTHGAGSFCTATVASSNHSTIGDEIRTNPVLAHQDEGAFVEDHLSGLVPYPDYYQHMGPANLAGLPPANLTPPPILAEANYAELDDVTVIDARPKVDFAVGHLPGAIGVELRNDFAVWVGWIVPHNSRLVLVMSVGQDVNEAMRQLVRIGFDRVVGVITDLEHWTTPLSSHAAIDVSEFAGMVADGAQVLDVRSPADWATGTIEDSELCYAPDLARAVPDGLDPDRPVLVACGTGYRASIAASFLEAKGFEPVVLVGAGVPDVLNSL